MSGFVIWFTGLSASGKTTIANIVEPELERRGYVVDHLDGDIVRTHLSKGLGYSKADRDANIERIGWVASRLARAGAAVVVSAISPYAEARRDPKGLYARAFAGELENFTGVSAPYEEPHAPELRLDTTGATPTESAAVVLARLAELHLLTPEAVA
jgi:adenylylsulfate kinase